MTPNLLPLLTSLGFKETAMNTATFFKDIPPEEANGIEGVRAYIKFSPGGGGKGFCFYTVKGCTDMLFHKNIGFHTAIGELAILKQFKEERDRLFEAEHKQDVQEFDVRLVLNMRHKDYREALKTIEQWHKSGLIVYSSSGRKQNPSAAGTIWDNEDFEKFLKEQEART